MVSSADSIVKKTLFDKQCNEWEAWQKEWDCSENLVRTQILNKARKYLRSEVLNKWKRVGNNSSFVFNITYHPVLLKLKNVPSEIHLLLTRDREHGRVFKRIPTVCFRRAKRLKDVLLRVKVAPLEKKKGS